MNLIGPIGNLAAEILPEVIPGPAGRIAGRLVNNIINEISIPVPESHETIQIVGKTMHGKTQNVRISKFATGSELAVVLENAFGRHIQQMSFRGMPIDQGQRLSDLGMRDGDVVLLSNLFQGGGHISI